MSSLSGLAPILVAATANAGTPHKISETEQKYRHAKAEIASALIDLAGTKGHAPVQHKVSCETFRSLPFSDAKKLGFDNPVTSKTIADELAMLLRNNGMHLISITAGPQDTMIVTAQRKTVMQGIADGFKPSW